MPRSTGLSDVKRAFVQRCRVGRMATVDQNGEAYLVPVCYAFDGQHFFTPIDEKPKRWDRPLKRVRNIQETGRASLIIDHYDDEDWSRLAWLMVRGRAEVIQPDHPLHPSAVQLLRRRYRQYRDMNLEEADVIVLTPERIAAWGISD
jgi:PPOX class probable F420-dependent enzyme